MTYADSTIGMTLYNLIGMLPMACGVEHLHQTAVSMQHADLDITQVQRALDKLVKLGRVERREDGTYAPVASENLMVVRRDLRDYDSMTMQGGWTGWLVKDPRIRDGKGTRPLEQLLPRAPASLKEFSL